MIYEVRHTTIYRYQAPASVSHHVARLKPRELPFQKPLSHRVDLDPAPTVWREQPDYYGNTMAFFTVQQPHHELQIRSQSRVELSSPPGIEPDASAPWEAVRELAFEHRLTEAGRAMEFAFDSPLVPRAPAYAEYGAVSFTAHRPVLAAAVDLMQRIHREFEFDPEASSVATPVSETFQRRRGVCQDFAHLMLACLRSLGLPARYVSGYLETSPPPGQPKLEGADASHAWVAVFCPRLGWLELDPTNAIIPGERHVRLAWGQDYSDVSPIRGVLVGSGEHELEVAVDVIPQDG